MVRSIKEHVVIQAGGLIEIRRADLPEGLTAAVTVEVEDGAQKTTLLSFFGKGKGCFKNAAEVDAFIRSERDAWDS
jgi:hypothetical protein